MYKIDVGEGVKKLINEVVGFKKNNDQDGIVKCLQEMTENPEAVISSLPDFDCDEVLLYVDDYVTVYYIATSSKILYPPHEHGMIAVSALYKGTETHVFYNRDGENVVERNRVTFEAPAVVDLTIETVHAICTYDDEPNQGLHFYLGDLEGQKRTLWDSDGKNPQQYIHEKYLSLSRPFN
ncbi:MAG: hypothetical protein JKY84_14375 [Emcibacteraceae bacterium]|nr:hypothetical protein [Emcibacteraceae bacterium]